MLQTLLATILVLIFSPSDSWSSEQLALSMVPRGKIWESHPKEFIIKTPAGTKVGVEFKRDGSFEEASGHNLNKGDVFEPGMGLISLSTAAQKLSEAGGKISGYWSLSKDNEYDWIYEFEEEREDIKLLFIVKAATGEVVSD
jgi:hypothetical protein